MARGRLHEAACWAHLRRDVHDVWTPTKSEIAREALDRIGKFYDIARDINGQSADVRHATRQKLARPKGTAFFACSEQKLLRIPGKSDLAKAFRYGPARQEAFGLFLSDGRVASTTPRPDAPCARLEQDVKTGSSRAPIPALKPSHAR